MVNKCSLVGCKSLYVKEPTKLHRFPLTDTNILPLWIAITGKESDWKPNKSSRLCGNHFIITDYIPDHKKGLLKPTSIPSIEYRVNVPRYRRNNVKLYPNYNKLFNQTKDLNKLIKVEYVVQENETECDETASYQGNGQMTMQYNQETTINIKHYDSSNFDNDKFLKEDENSDDEMMQCESKDNSGYQNKNDVCNRKNQCYKFTKSLIESFEPIIPTLSAFNKFNDYLSDKNHSTFMSNNYTESTDSSILISSTEYQNRSFENTDKQIREPIFNNIMTSKLKKQRCTQEIYSLYFNSPKIKNIFSPEESIDLPNDDVAMMKQSLTTELNGLYPFLQIYEVIKQKIQNILMQAKVKILNSA